MSRWEYTDARGSSHGTMRCTSCNKQITEGRYRYRQKSNGDDWAYVAQHESCTTEDPQWARLDERAAQRRAKIIELSDACREFRSKWGVDELDAYIIEEPK